jgi:hypothetical protein
MRYVYENPSVEYDNETLQMMQIADKIEPANRSRFERQIEERKAMIRAGLNRHPHIDEKIKEFCPELRTRYDFERGKLVIEHFHPQTSWQMIGGGEWPEDEKGNPLSAGEVIEKLKAGDMQRIGHVEYLKQKKDAAEKIQKRNDAANTEKVAAAVDSLSTKQVRQFIDVQNAIRTGETVVPLGDDAKFLDKAHVASKKHGKPTKKAVRNDQRAAMNPGQHPLIYQRNQK